MIPDEVIIKNSNPFGDIDDVIISNAGDILENNKLINDDLSLNNHHLSHDFIDDNKMLETVQEDAYGEYQTKKVNDFSEKKEFSFEREEFEKELDPLNDAADVAAAASDVINEVIKAAAEKVNSSFDDDAPQSMDSFIVPESDHGECRIVFLYESIIILYFEFRNYLLNLSKNYREMLI